ncbi:MAG: DUF5615 family PIN-like protein [Chloroflexi bacterium]|nr:DUF5615 family PIN-like protein [Chloroflexota bacterium]
MTDGLTLRGTESTDVARVGRRGLSGEQQLDWALEHGYVLVTYDPDFVEDIRGRVEYL